TPRRSGARWPSSAGSACPSRRSRAAPGWDWSSWRSCWGGWGARRTRGGAWSPGPIFASVVLGGLDIQLGGSPAQKEKWLPAIASGQARASAALLEDALDWDAASAAASATHERDGCGR